MTTEGLSNSRHTGSYVRPRPDTDEYTDEGLSDRVKMFLSRYKDNNGGFKYIEQIDNMMPTDSKYIVIDYNDLVEEPQIERYFRSDPDRILDAFSRAIYDTLRGRFPDYAKHINNSIGARITNFPIHKSVDKVDSSTIGSLISVSGMISSTSEVKPSPVTLVYVCQDNHRTITQTPNPPVCANPECKHRQLTRVDKESRYLDHQEVVLRELPEEQTGSTSKGIRVQLYGDLVKMVQPGDRVTATVLVQTWEGKHGMSFNMRCNNVEPLDKADHQPLIGDEYKEFSELAAQPNFYEKIIECVAPHIQGRLIEKEAVLLALAGSPTHNKGVDKTRGDINILLVGDPGTGKSDILRFVTKVAPRGLYTSGTGNSAAGLTVAAVQEKDGRWTLQAGAAVIASGGVLCIDEFEKMSDTDRGALHEVMENQTASIAKAGMVGNFPAHTTIVAAANPKKGHYDINETVPNNIGFPTPLLSRFDLILIVRDIPDPTDDKKIINHILSRYDKHHTLTPIMDPRRLKKYLMLVRQQHPRMTNEAAKQIEKFYMSIRSANGTSHITPRIGDALVRLSTARARLLLHDTVTTYDVDRATYLITESLASVAKDPTTGEVDVGILSQDNTVPYNRMVLVQNLLKEIGPTSHDDLLAELLKSGMFTHKKEANNTIHKAARTGFITKSGDSYVVR